MSDAPTSDPLAGYERLLWDLDGTLCDLGVDWKALKSELREQLGASAEPRTLADLLEVAREQERWDATLAWIATFEVAALNRDPQLIPASLALFRRHRERSAILTNNTAPAVRRFFELAEVQPVPFASRDRAGVSKPDVRYLELLRDHWDGKRTVLIGDTDIDAALAAKGELDFVHVRDLIALGA
jgi:HAD superfamily hydrolase (TIGR01549 family)